MYGARDLAEHRSLPLTYMLDMHWLIMEQNTSKCDTMISIVPNVWWSQYTKILLSCPTNP